MLLFVDTVGIIFYVLGGIIAVLALALFIFKIYIREVNRNARRKKVDLPLKASELARANLDKAGLVDIEIVVKTFKTGYSYRKKKLYISKAMERKLSVFAVSRVMQLVSLAILNNTDESARKTTALANGFVWGASTLFFVMIVVSIITAFVATSGNQIFVLVALILALVFYVIAMIVAFKKVKLIKRANADAMVYIENLEIFDEKEKAQISKIYKLSVKEHTIDTILAVVYFIYYFLKVFYQISKVVRKK
ncbi:MAG: zinc metallopeptidase [Clostridia bacterium]|nr:zinc metallopeptidase [Clostridia bacterium]